MGSNQGEAAASAGAGRLRLVFRSYGGENAKGRPDYYSKDLVLASFIRAAQRVDADVLFVNDGPIPGPRLAAMHRHGDVIAIPDGPVGMRGSYRFGLNLPDRLGWPDEDVVAFHEDDYLFAPDAFEKLADAVGGLPRADYFALCAFRPQDLNDPHERRLHQAPRHWHPDPDAHVRGTTWRNVLSVTSTFAARVSALRADHDIFLLAMKPFRKRFLDHETCLMYQGIVPYHGVELAMGLPGDFVPGLRGIARTIYLTPYRFALNRRARAQAAGRPHRLYACTPTLAAHLEAAVMTDHELWRERAHDTARWAREHGLEVSGRPA